MKILQRIAAVMLLSAAIGAGFVSCAKKNADSLSKIKGKGEIVIATSPDFPPFEFLDENRNITGLEIELFKKIADNIGVKVNIQSVDFDSIIPGVVSGKYDMGVSGFSITEERKKNILFSSPYTLAGIAIVVREDDRGIRVKSPADLKGKKISVQSGTTSDTFCVENGLNVNAYASNTEAELALVTGKVDVWAIDNAVGAQMVRTYNADHSDKLVMLDDLLSYEEYAFIAAKGSDSLINAVNAQLDELRKNGIIDALFKKFDADYKAAF